MMNNNKPLSINLNSPTFPTDELLKNIKSDKFNRDGADYENDILSLRRNDVSKPTIFIGTGTCGLGAGAQKTINSAKSFLSKRGIKADIIRVGCIGLCSVEPIMDIQLPGMTRISFGNVHEGDAPRNIRKHIGSYASQIKTFGTISQQRFEGVEWVNYLDENPFLRCNGELYW